MNNIYLKCKSFVTLMALLLSALVPEETKQDLSACSSLYLE